MTRDDADVVELPTDPGARLKRQREAAGFTEQYVAERLNLDSGVVIALEHNDFAALGAPVFARGHLKRYAALLGLAESDILGAYDRSRLQLAQPSLIPKAREEMAPLDERSRRPWLAGGAIAFLAAAGIAAYLSQYGMHLPSASMGRSVTAGVPTSPDVEVAPGVGRQGAQGGAATAATTRPVAQTSGSSIAIPPGQLLLTFDFTADCWVEVSDGAGKSVLYDLGKAGTQRAVTGVAPLSVTLGNGPAVMLSVNGRRVVVPQSPDEQAVVRFVVGADGTLRSG